MRRRGSHFLLTAPPDHQMAVADSGEKFDAVATELPAEVATDRLARVARIPMRLLGDSVLRRTAWKLADEHGWASTFDAEYLALTELQGDALITLDDELIRKAKGVVAVASINELLAAGRPSGGS